MEKNVKNYFTKSTISNIITVCTAVLLYLGISHFDMVKNVASHLYGIISPFVVAFVLAFLLNTPVKWFENNMLKVSKGKRGTAIFCAYLVTALAITVLAVMVAPQVRDSILNVVNSVPEYIRQVSILLQKLTTDYNLDPKIVETITETLSSAFKSLSAIALNLIPQIFNASVSLGSLIIDLFMAVIASIYMLASKERLIFQIKKILYSFLKEKRADRVIEIGQRANLMFSKFINGKIIDSIIIGIMCFVGTLFIYSPYAILLGVIVGVTNVIPFFGPFIGAIPSILILLMVSPWDALIFAIFVLALQQFDGNILGPKILGDSTGLAPIWVLVAITIGGGMFGFVGMVAGVPTFAVIYSLLSENMDKRLAAKKIIADKDAMTLTPKGEEVKDEPNS